MGDTEDLTQLRAILTNASGDTPLAHRFRALFSLKSLGREGINEAIDIIEEAFNDDSALLKHELAYVLGQTKNRHAVPTLQNVLKDENEDPMVRHEAAEALGAIGDKGSLVLLKEYFEKDPLEVVRQTCELAIARIEWEHSKLSKQEVLEESQFSSIDPAPPLPYENTSVEQLQKILVDQSLSLFERYRAMFRLRDLGTAESVDALITGFNDPSALFRHEIAYVFGQLCDPRSVNALVNVLQNEDEEGMVRHEAAEALGSIATDDVMPVLQKFMQDKERVVRESAVVALDMYEYERSGEMEYASVQSASTVTA
ncbi:armadillo-type protein [Lipomyces orientalis]|uniref:Armadillo-type protein n=1 Tax=Lipomyces orientalis TaxID=1233043 RepID=A0ACC3TPR7_9ASCO